MSFEEWLAAKEFDAETLSDSQRLALQVAWRAELNLPPVDKPNDPSATMDQIFAAQKAENDRLKSITDMVSRYVAEYPSQVGTIEQIGRLAVAGKWDTQKAELQLLRCVRSPGGPIISVPINPQVTAEVVEAAVCRSGGLKDAEKQFNDRTLSAVDKHYRRGIGLQQLIGMAARQRGWRGESVRDDLQNAMKLAFRDPGDMPQLSLGVSTISVPGILSNVANKFLREAFMFVEAEWRKITAVRSVPDFKQATSYTLTGDNTYERIAPGGKIKHGTLGNESYTNQADTYGKILGIDRRDLINDDLGAFAGVNRRLGRGGALKINEVFWTEFLADPSTFWTALRGNYDDGTDTAFSNDGLTAADVIWQAKTDPDGKPLGTTAKYLVVPPGHKVAAWRLINSMLFGTTGEEGERNPWAGKFEVVSSVYLANSAMGGGYSSLAWYLLADPNDLPVIEVCFLNGVEMPTIENVELDGDQLGMAIRAYWDFGVNKQEYRGGLKLKGEA